MTDASRRLVLQSAAGLALITALPARAAEMTPGKPGDFDFLTGEWKIANRWRQTAADAFIEFPGEATVTSILSGTASVEELRIPARGFFGMGLRLLDQEKKLWVDYWVNAKSGALGREGTLGSFEQGAGIFDSEDKEDGKPVIWRGLWDRIVPGKSHNWSQLVSRDGGQSWEATWLMEWTRA